jgi:hypothetical protein
MARIDSVFLLLASACLIIGVCLGIYMGVNEDLQLVAVHHQPCRLGIAGAVRRDLPALSGACGVAPCASSFLALRAECGGFSGRDLSGAGSSDPCRGDRNVSALAVGRAGLLRGGCKAGVSAVVVSLSHTDRSVRAQLLGGEALAAQSRKSRWSVTWS